MKARYYPRGAHKSGPALDFRLSVCPALAQKLIEWAEREGRPRPRVRITDYSQLKACRCADRKESDVLDRD